MTAMDSGHDPQKTLSDLRDHLARHDKPIAFLFGAGTSCSVRIASQKGDTESQSIIPTVAGLTSICRDDVLLLGDKFVTAWGLIETHCKEIGQAPNIENILSRLRMMVSAAGNTDTLSGLNRSEICAFEERVRKTIARVVTPNLDSIQGDFAHRMFARWLAKTARKSPVEIFTVNYDVLIEHGLEVERIPVFDGFVGSYRPFFLADSLRRQEAAPGAKWARLWKMHGSVTWRRIEQNGRERVVRGEPDPNGAMIYPSYEKYDESRQQPYSAFADRLSRFLDQDDAMLVVAGFSFGDEHINNLIFGALENRPRTHVYSLQFDELPEESELVKRAYQRPNMIVIGPRTGIVGGRRAPWSPVELPSFMHDVFILTEAPHPIGGTESGSSNAKIGLMKIGDFSVLCGLLHSMTSD